MAGALRAVVWLSLPPATWFSGDSFSYVTAAVRPEPGLWRPSGYSLLLLLPLRPAHSLALVTAVQHLLGLGVGVAVYVLLLRYRVPRWAATLAVVPVLLDAYLVSTEQMLLSEALFIPLVVLALTLLLWKPVGPGVVLASVGGLLLGLAAVTRSVGLALVVVAAVLLLVRRAGLARVAALLVAAALPVGVYAAWYHHDYRRWGTSASGGLFLYGRVSQFVDCGRLNGLDPVVRALCPAESVGSRRSESYYVFSPLSPAQRVAGPMTNRNELAGRFARQAVLNQPGDYLSECWHALVTLFSASDDTTADRYLLRAQAAVPRSDLPTIHGYDHGSVDTRPDPRGVDALLAYQWVARVPGLACLLALLVAGAGAAFGRDTDGRGMRGAILALAGSAAVLYLVPVMTVGPDVRYRFPTVPLLAAAGCLGLALLVGRVVSVRWRRVAVAHRPGLVRPAAAGVDPTGLEVTRPDLSPLEAAGPDGAAPGAVESETPGPPARSSHAHDQHGADQQGADRRGEVPHRERQRGDDPDDGKPGAGNTAT
ncbi:MAG TPA: hypothetical protein VIS06_23060 [Mycobacteriales bacterium]